MSAANFRDSKFALSTLKKRGDELTMPTNIDGLYNQLLFDLCADDALMAFVLFGKYNSVLDRIGFETDNVQHRVVNFLTYIAPDGTADGSPTSGVQTDPCEPGQSVESGTCSYELSGWGRLRRSSETRDITDVVIKYCEAQPTYNIAGERIDDDYVWDLTRITATMLQDFQRQLIIGNKANAGEHDGLSRIINYGYADNTGKLCSAMDSIVVNYGGNAMCPPLDEDGEFPTTGITVNGQSVADGYIFLDFVNSWLRRVHQRISMSSLSGDYSHIGLIPTETLNCLVDCYVCYTTCGRDVTRMNEPEVRIEMARLKNEMNGNKSITLNHEGIPVTWYAYDYELINTNNGRSDVYILTPSVGSTPLLRIQTKDMATVANHPAVRSAEMRVSDNRRILSWNTVDHTCYQVHSELQWRIWNVAPWAQMRITGVACTPLYGHISTDPLSPYYPEQNLVASNKVPNVVPVADFTFVVANSDQVTWTNTTTLTNPALPVTYLWLFGDGTTSTLKTPPMKDYGGAGTRYVTLIVTDGNGNQSTKSSSVVTT